MLDNQHRFPASYLKPEDGMMRLLTLCASAICAFLIAISAYGQGATIHLLQCDAMIDGAHGKLAAEVVKNLDPQALISWDGQLMKIRLNSGIEQLELLRALNQGAARFAILGGDPRSGMPVRIDTGDPSGDDLRYEQAKAAWLNQQQSLVQPVSPAKE